MNTWRECASAAVLAGALAMAVFGFVRGGTAAIGYVHDRVKYAAAEREAKEIAIIRRALAAHEADKRARQ